MNKMQIAHEMALELVKIKPSLSAWQIADRCFEYADAMQAEADKRECKERPEVLGEDPFKGLYPFIDWRNHGRGLYHFWAMDEDGRAFWHNREPKINEGKWDSYHKYKAPLFDYQSNWQDSLRKRPQ